MYKIINNYIQNTIMYKSLSIQLINYQLLPERYAHHFALGRRLFLTIGTKPLALGRVHDTDTFKMKPLDGAVLRITRNHLRHLIVRTLTETVKFFTFGDRVYATWTVHMKSAQFGTLYMKLVTVVAFGECLLQRARFDFDGMDAWWYGGRPPRWRVPQVAGFWCGCWRCWWRFLLRHWRCCGCVVFN